MKYFDHEYRVRYADTDKMGITYYANYLVWFEAARTEYFRALGLPYTECEKEGHFLPVIESRVKYLAPSTYDDFVVVRTSVAKMGHSSLHFEYQVFLKSSQKLLTTGMTAHVFVDQKMKPERIPEKVKNLVEVHKLLSEG